MSTDFRDKVVIVTGASSGIGERTAIMFAQHGAKVVLCGRDEQRLSGALQKCQEKSGGQKDRFIIVQGDITDAEVRHTIIQRTLDSFGRLDILVSNAGTMVSNGALSDATEDAFDHIMNVNLKAGFFLVLEATPYLEKTQGCIVLVSSTCSTLVDAGEFIYSLSKTAVDHMARTLALGLAPKGIRVNVINPTVVVTRLLRDNNISDEEMESAYKEYEHLHPLHRRNATVQENAHVIIFLASSDASFVTGQCVKNDGGFLLMTAGILE